jgi:hypothetical protein
MPPQKPVARRTLAPQPPPAALYASSYTPERGAAICRRLAAGESLRAICRDDPAMPTEKTVWNWARAHREFALIKAHALETARAASRAKQAERDAARLGRPAAKDARGWRRGCTEDWPWVVDALCARLMCGETLAEACADPDMPSVGTVYNWLRRDPALAERYRAAKAYGVEAYVNGSCEHLPWIGERKSWPMRRRTLKAAERRAARLKLSAYAPATTAAALRVQLEDAAGEVRTLYEVRRG